MQIYPVRSYQPNFDGTSRLRLKDGSTAVLNVLTDKGRVNKISCKVFLKRQVLKELNYSWKNGISIGRLNAAAAKIGKELGLQKDEAQQVLSDKIFDAYMEDCFNCIEAQSDSVSF